MKKIYDRIVDIRGNIVTVKASGVRLKELAHIYRRTGGITLASVLSIDGEKVALQVFENPRGISTGDRVFFLGHTMRAVVSSSLLGRRLNGRGSPIDGGPDIVGTQVEVGGPSFNPVKRKMPHEMVETSIPMIDVFNCLVKSQKIPIFSTAGEPYYQLLMRIANQTSADIVMIGGMGLRYEDYQEFVENAEKSGAMEKTTMFIHQATDPVVECLLVPDMVLASAEYFATRGHNVLVLFADMTVFADAIKELMISMDQIPSNRGYPGSLYSDLASRYEKAVDIDGSGSITIISVTTMPGGDVTHPIPDNTGYITEGQFYLNEGRIDPFGSLSRLKQQVIGHVTREDHGEVANAQIRLYAESKKAQERQSMGFRLSQWDEKLLAYRSLFEEKMMDFEVNIPVGQALDLGWEILSHCFDPQETGIKQELINIYWPNDANQIHKE